MADAQPQHIFTTYFLALRRTTKVHLHLEVPYLFSDMGVCWFMAKYHN